MFYLILVCSLNLVVFIVVSTYTKGSHMVPILNALNVQCAVYGNHDFGMNTLFCSFMLFFEMFVTGHHFQVLCSQCTVCIWKKLLN